MKLETMIDFQVESVVSLWQASGLVACDETRVTNMALKKTFQILSGNSWYTDHSYSSIAYWKALFKQSILHRRHNVYVEVNLGVFSFYLRTIYIKIINATWIQYTKTSTTWTPCKISESPLIKSSVAYQCCTTPSA